MTAEFDFSSGRKPDLASVVSKIDNISTLPQILKKILNVTANPKSAAADLEEILKSDSAMTGKIIRVANSSYYGLSQKILTVKRAVVFLGFKTVKNLAIAASVCDLFKSYEQINDFTREELWKHSVVVALCSRSICLRAGLDIGDDVFTSGIMHDIGIVIEDQYMNNDFARVLQSPELDASGMIEIERSVFGFDHAALGESVAQSWKIPDEITKVIAYHHKPRAVPLKYRIPASIVYLADLLTAALKMGYIIKSRLNKDDLNFAMDAIGFSSADMAVVVEELPAEINKARELIAI